MVWIVSLLFFYKDGFGIKKITHEGWYAVKQRNQTKHVAVEICVGPATRGTKQYFSHI